MTTEEQKGKYGFCPQCIHGREQGDYREITLRNGGEMLSLLNATMLWAQTVKEQVKQVLARLDQLGDGQPESVIERIGKSFVQVDLQGQKGWMTLGIVQTTQSIPLPGHQTLGTVVQTRQGCFLVPPPNPEKVLCASTETRRQLTMVGTTPVGCGH